MSYSLQEIKRDLEQLDVRHFYMKYIVKSYNWYFSEVLNIPETELLQIIDEFKDIVSSNIGVSFNNVMMVGSGKVGYSLSPKKNFKSFQQNSESDNKSDIDIAVISQDLFKYFWDLYRKAYSVKYNRVYSFISREIYRGYINERNLREIEACRKEWNNLCNNSNRLLRTKLYLKHDITYRIYRSWEDFEEYNLNSIESMKEKVTIDAI
ncbi:hypothetical protein [Paenibacillus sp. PDC88]|uniref:hypothetical protein n=1 Tax=Paenibacillus sp. PDC88 TaxID=1884375 RepID=UPI00089B2386|nr:hypothetical protein [Paenibacillus sp. PDC88]SDX43257.1 hypothetical protein SAMN05518848_107150 [Paenibacillus sp. PDC88]